MSPSGFNENSKVEKFKVEKASESVTIQRQSMTNYDIEVEHLKTELKAAKIDRNVNIEMQRTIKELRAQMAKDRESRTQ